MRNITSSIGTINKRAVVQSNTVARLSGAALLAGGAVAAIGYALVSFQPEQDPTTISNLLYLVTCLLMLVGSILVVLGLPTAYTHLFERSSGALSLIGYVTTVVLLLTNTIVYTAIRALVFPMILYIKQHPLITFIVLAFLLSWWIWPLAALGLPLFPPGPFLAAIAVLTITHGKRGVTGLLRGMVQWRVAPRWYALVFGLPLALIGAAVGLNVLLGAAAPSAADLIGQSRLLLLFPLLLLIPGAGGAWSEPGWRGYALPRLLAGRSALLASLALGVVVALWHLPLILAGRQPLGDLPWLVVWSVMFTWIFKGTGGSVAIAMLFHAWDDTLVNFSKALFAGADAAQLAWLQAGVYALAAIAIVALAGPNLARQPAAQSDSIAEPMAAIQ